MANKRIDQFTPQSSLADSDKVPFWKQETGTTSYLDFIQLVSSLLAKILVQSSGNATNKVMSQKAVTDLLEGSTVDLSNYVTVGDVNITTGTGIGLFTNGAFYGEADGLVRLKSNNNDFHLLVPNGQLYSQASSFYSDIAGEYYLSVGGNGYFSFADYQLTASSFLVNSSDVINLFAETYFNIQGGNASYFTINQTGNSEFVASGNWFHFDLSDAVYFACVAYFDNMIAEPAPPPYSGNAIYSRLGDWHVLNQNGWKATAELNGLTADVKFALLNSAGHISGLKRPLNFTIEGPTNKTYPLVSSADIATTLTALNGLRTTTGTCTIALHINGSPVTFTGGVTTINVTSTPQNINITSGGSVNSGNEISIVVTSAAAPVDLRGTISR